MRDRSFNTLFMLSSLDGKISTGDVDERDVDIDFLQIAGIKEGLHQYYDLEKQTDRVSFNSGRVQAKIGVNHRTWDTEKSDMSFVVVDNKPHLDEQGTEYFAKRSQRFILITTNARHPAFKLKDKHPTIHILLYEGRVDFTHVFRKFKQEFGIERITIQTGGTLNAKLLRLGLIDRISLVIAPCLIGGERTASLIGGPSLRTQSDLMNIKPLKLISCEVLKDSYVHIQYEVIN